MDKKLYRRRVRTNRIGLTLSMLAMGLGLFVLLWILSVLFINGFAAIDMNMFFQSTPAPGSEGGGLANAIVGSLLLVGFATLFSTPIGILAGVYLAEYGDRSKIAEVTRFVTDIMLSAPSIVLGLFVYAIIVAQTKQFSGWAGTVALSLIAIPVVLRTTENMLRLVPGSLREAAFALGAPQWKVATMVTLRAAKSGVVTGLLLAVARISGETAPLLFTALNNQFFSMDMTGPMANLPVVIFQFAMSPYDNWIRLAWGGALLITLAPGSYTAQVSGGATTGFALTEVFLVDGNLAPGIPPALLAPLASRTFSAGDNLHLSAPTLAKPHAVTYEWRRNGELVSGTPLAGFPHVLYLPSATATDAGNYTLTMINSAGVTTTAPFTLSLPLRHSADYNPADGVISLDELLRVIQLYNVRNGSLRTGAYAVSATGEDGFAPDAARSNAAVVTLAKYHSADTNRDGKLSLLELTRVIELFNFRNGTTRTGQYRHQAGTEDGFAPGP